MGTFVLAVWLMLSASGCYSPPPNPPDMVQAEQLIWSFYMETSSPPYVFVISGDNLTCNEGQGFPGEYNGHSACLAGLTMFPDTVEVAQPGQPWHNTALAHEYMHVHQAYNGIYDPRHTGEVWQPGGMVDEANLILSNHGL